MCNQFEAQLRAGRYVTSQSAANLSPVSSAVVRVKIYNQWKRGKISNQSITQFKARENKANVKPFVPLFSLVLIVGEYGTSQCQEQQAWN